MDRIGVTSDEVAGVRLDVDCGDPQL